MFLQHQISYCLVNQFFWAWQLMPTLFVGNLLDLLFPLERQSRRGEREERRKEWRWLATDNYILISEDDNDHMEIEDASDNDNNGSSDDEDDEVSGQMNTEEAKANVKVKLLSLIQVK